MSKIPADFPVRPLRSGATARDLVTCGTCGRSWDDAIATEYTPAPSGRCPFEYYHAPPKPAPPKPAARFWRDQYGAWFRADTRAELLRQVGGGSVHIMYHDKGAHECVRIGYVIGRHWLQEFAAVERAP